MKIVRQEVSLLRVTPDSERLIEIAGRTCYKSEDRITPRSSAQFINNIIRSGHHSVLEHAIATARIVTARNITHQIVRHRLASYSQESTRYCNYSLGRFSSECQFIEPPGLEGDQYELWREACEYGERTYNKLVTAGVRPEIARDVLPGCLKTEIVMTANFREWMHFIKIRSSKHAHPQIQEVARMVRRALEVYAPNVFFGA